MAAARADEHYRLGRLALSRRSPRAAATHFLAGMSDPLHHRQVRCLSYYGLSTAMAEKPDRKAIDCCLQAADQDPTDAELLVNLARVYYIAGLPTRCLSAVVRGLRIAPGHRGLHMLLDKVDRRGLPVLPSFHRDHPLNRSLGRLRAAFFPRKGPVAAGPKRKRPAA